MNFSLYYRSVLNFSAYPFWKYLNMTSQLSTGSKQILFSSIKMV